MLLLESQPDQPAARSRFVFYLSCLGKERSEPTVYDQILLLATLAHLRIPAVFDELSSWPTLPAAVESFLSGQLCRPKRTLSLRPLQFVLLDSSLSYVRGVLGGQGVLYGRQNLGVLRSIRMPEPSVHIIAGLLQAHHPTMYPKSLLRIMCTHGRSLHRLASTPQMPLLEVGDLEMSELTMIKGENLGVLTVVMLNGAAQISELESGTAEARQLVDAGYLDVEPRDCDSIVLRDPVLITRQVLQPAISRHSPLPDDDGQASPPHDADVQLPAAVTDMNSELEAAAERQLQLAEGKVLGLLARKDLLCNILENVGYAGKGRYYIWWGGLGPAEFDGLIYFQRGPVILVSCKRTQSALSEATFTGPITVLANMVERRQRSSRVEPQDVTYTASKAIVGALTAPGSELIMVGLSAQPVPHHQLNVTSHINVTNRDGEQRSVPCRYVPLLVEQLVRPVAVEPVQQAVPLSSMTW